MAIFCIPLISFTLRKGTRKIKGIPETHERHETHETPVVILFSFPVRRIHRIGKACQPWNTKGKHIKKPTFVKWALRLPWFCLCAIRLSWPASLFFSSTSHGMVRFCFEFDLYRSWIDLSVPFFESPQLDRYLCFFHPKRILRTVPLGHICPPHRENKVLSRTLCKA